jgi:chemotaxis protein MotB
MAEKNDQAPIVIKKVKKGGHDGHHGGAWKVAYADFVTAMMAFFLLLWLLNVTTEEQKIGIADYFAPASAAPTKSGSGGVLGGTVIAPDGQMRSTSGPPGISQTIPPPVVDSPDDETESDDENRVRLRGPTEAEPEPDSKESKTARSNAKRQADGKIEQQRLLEIAEAEREQRLFAETAEALRQAVQDSPDLQRLAESLVIDQTDEGLRIQIIDQDKLPMFELGSSQMLPQARKLFELIAKTVNKMPKQIAVTGHTDARPYANRAGYGNWELSSDRANASRRVLMELGVPAERITRVTGKAETDHLVPEDPLSPRNRRVSIVVLRERPAKGT